MTATASGSRLDCRQLCVEVESPVLKSSSATTSPPAASNDSLVPAARPVPYGLFRTSRPGVERRPRRSGCRAPYPEQVGRRGAEVQAAVLVVGEVGRRVGRVENGRRLPSRSSMTVKDTRRCRADDGRQSCQRRRSPRRWRCRSLVSLESRSRPRSRARCQLVDLLRGEATWPPGRAEEGESSTLREDGADLDVKSCSQPSTGRRRRRPWALFPIRRGRGARNRAR